MLCSYYSLRFIPAIIIVRAGGLLYHGAAPGKKWNGLVHGKLQMSQLPSSALLDFWDEKKNQRRKRSMWVFTNSLPQAVVATGGVGTGWGWGAAENRARRLFFLPVCNSQRTLPFRHSLPETDTCDSSRSLCFSLMVSMLFRMGSGI